MIKTIAIIILFALSALQCVEIFHLNKRVKAVEMRCKCNGSGVRAVKKQVTTAKKK